MKKSAQLEALAESRGYRLSKRSNRGIHRWDVYRHGQPAPVAKWMTLAQVEDYLEHWPERLRGEAV